MTLGEFGAQFVLVRVAVTMPQDGTDEDARRDGEMGTSDGRKAAD
jgi:hypothetical protein